MAMSLRLAEHVDNMIRCPMCREDMNDPRSLPCLHTFCMQCIQGRFETNYPGDTAECPVCREKIRIPDNGIQAFKTNFHVKGLTDARKTDDEQHANVDTVETEPSSKPCLSNTSCSQRRIPLGDAMLRTECGGQQGNSCGATHDRFHKVAAADETTTCALRMSESRFCKTHEGNRHDFYCLSCEKSICSVCSRGSHKEHTFHDIDEMNIKFAGILEADLKHVMAEKLQCQERLNEQQSHEKKLTDCAEAIETAIVDQAVQVKEFIDTCVRRKQNQILQKREELANDIKIAKDDNELNILAQQSLERQLHDLLDSGSPCDITHMYRELHTSAEAVLKRHHYEDLTLSHFDDDASEFLREIISFVTEMLPGGGHFADERKNRHAQMKQTTYEHLNVADNLKRTTALYEPIKDSNCIVEETNQSLNNKNKVIDGIACLNNNIYVRFGNSKKIVVYERDKFNRLYNVAVPGMKTVTDLTSCSRNQCVYIADSGNDVVHRIENKNNLTRWPVSDRPAGLSVNAACNVLVTCRRAGKIKAFTTYGHLIREIELQSDIVNPWHTVELTTGQFIVCHGESNDSLNRVCIVNDTGNVLRSYGGKPGSAIMGQMNRPLRLAVMQGFFLVADYFNRRILLLDSTFSSVPEGILRLSKLPFRLWYDEQTRRLYVAEDKWKSGKCVGGKIKVFRLQQ